MYYLRPGLLAARRSPGALTIPMHGQDKSHRPRADNFDWGSLAPRLLNPVQVAIVEALWWIDEPLSAGDLAQIFGGEKDMLTLLHHLRRLASVEAATVVDIRRVRGATEKLFRLTSPGEQRR